MISWFALKYFYAHFRNCDKIVLIHKFWILMEFIGTVKIWSLIIVFYAKGTFR